MTVARTLGRYVRGMARRVFAYLVLGAPIVLAFHGSLRWLCAALCVAAVAGAVGGALGGGLAGRLRIYSRLGLCTRESAERGAVWGMAAGLPGAIAGAASHSPTSAVLYGLLLGAGFAFEGSLTGMFLSQAEGTYRKAMRRLRKGDQQGARKVIRKYLEHARRDEREGERRRVAERFLQGQVDTLAVPAELESAPAPAGRGTEPEAAGQPVGRGTEPEAAGRPAGRQARL